MALSTNRILLAAAAACATALVHAAMRVPDAANRSDRGASAPDSFVAGRFMALGFDALVADYRWLQAIQVIGEDHADPATQFPAVQRLLDEVVALDPWVDHPYRFAAVWLVNTPQQVRAANRMLERGIAYHPLEWRDRFYLSFNQFFYLGDAEAAARELEPAIGLWGAPPYLGRLLARLRSERDGLEAAATYIGELAHQTDDPWRRAEYEKALDEIETERRARYLDRAREAYKSRTGHDIARVEDLVQGSDAVIPELPPELHGWGWILDPKTGAIVSAYYGNRYHLHMHEVDRRRIEEWSREAASGEGSG